MATPAHLANWRTDSSSITDLPGISVGHDTNTAGPTGCTAVVFDNPDGVTASGWLGGQSPGERDCLLLEPSKTVERINAVMFTGGSAFGLAAADGVMRYLEETGRGFITPACRVPIVPSCVIYDLAIGDASIRPTVDMGYRAAKLSGKNPDNGSVGAGTGASAGKFRGHRFAMKGGLGTVSTKFSSSAGEEYLVAALAVANPFGNVTDPATGEIIAGALEEIHSPQNPPPRFARFDESILASARWGSVQNTVLCLVATTAPLDKPSAARMSEMAAGGIQKTVHPACTVFDGDIVIGVSLAENGARLNRHDEARLGSIAADCVSAAILKGVYHADGLGFLPAAKEMERRKS